MAKQNPERKLSELNPLAATFEPKRENGVVDGNAKPVQKSDALVIEPKPLATFHPFPRMPSELRLKIWKLNMPGPRVIELKYSKKIYHAVSPTPALVLLHICREVGVSCS